MDAIHLTHVQLAKVEPGSLVLIGPTGADAEQYFAIAVRQAGESFATGLVSFRADRGALRAVRTDLSVAETPERWDDTLPSSPICSSKFEPILMSSPLSSQATCSYTTHCTSLWSRPRRTHRRWSLTWPEVK